MDAKELSDYIRRKSIEMTREANSSHIGSCLSVADILASIYSDDERVKAIKENLPSRDVVIMSKGHAAAALYAALAGVGVLDDSILSTFCKGILMGHVSHEVDGVEFSTGSLGHGLSLALGVALSRKDGKTICICSDGEMDEGSVWEAVAFAGHRKPANLLLFIDYNKIQSFGTVAEVLNLEPFADKLKAFNWNAIEIDGHDLDCLQTVLKGEQHEPLAVICHTVKGKGVARMENKLEWHYKSPTAEDTI